MRFMILISLLLIPVAGCVLHHEDDSPRQNSAKNPPAVSGDTAAADPGVEGDVVDEESPEGLSELLVDEEGRKQWKEIPLPKGWPEEIPLVRDARVIFRERAVHKLGVPNNIIMESQIPVDEAGQFYHDACLAQGWRSLDKSRAPQFYNCTFLARNQVVDINVRHIPEDLPGIEEVPSVDDTTSDFEGTVIKISILPAGDISHFKNAEAWYSLDDVPPGFPLNEVPRYPGGVVDMASFAAGDHVVLQQHCEKSHLAEVARFYREYFLKAGLEPMINEDTAEAYNAEFTGADCFIRLSVSQFANDDKVYFDIYKQITTKE